MITHILTDMQSCKLPFFNIAKGEKDELAIFIARARYNNK